MTMPIQSPPEPSLSLLPEVEARAALRGRTLHFRLLRPPFAAIGTGTLRVLRVADCAGGTEIVAGYDGYERLDVRERTNGER